MLAHSESIEILSPIHQSSHQSPLAILTSPVQARPDTGRESWGYLSFILALLETLPPNSLQAADGEGQREKPALGTCWLIV